MERFAQLYEQLDSSRKSSRKITALAHYFQEVPPDDAVWALWFLSGQKLNVRLRNRLLLQWAGQVTGLPDWLLDLSYERVGDLAETVALVLPEGTAESIPLHVLVEQHLIPVGDWDSGFQYSLVTGLWKRLSPTAQFLCNKLLTGGLRVGVARAVVIRGLAEAYGLPREDLLHRLMGNWRPTPAFFNSLIAAEEDPEARLARPLPFFLAHPLEGKMEQLGTRSEWQVEWKWDGIRAQLVKRQGRLHLWSRGEEEVSGAFPEVILAAAHIPGNFVLDGELLCWGKDGPLPFAILQTRLNRKRISPAMVSERPVIFLAYDCLESEGIDLRERPLADRRNLLEMVLKNLSDDSTVRPAPVLNQPDWDELRTVWQSARAHGVEGFMLKRLDSRYASGRVKGDWWKLKTDPLTADLVMIYAQAGHGNRGGLYTDYTLAAWDNDALVPVAKAYSGLSREELTEVDRWIKQHTRVRHGPVRVVDPFLVFEVAFDSLQASTRHRSGVAMRFPRIKRWRRDKPAAEADTVSTLKHYLPVS